MFLPNSHSFLLVKSVISKPAIQSGIFGVEEFVPTSAPGPSLLDSGQPTIVNKDKRTFLKVAGVAAASIVGSLLLPKKADAFIMGSSPTTGVVGVKNAANTRINPATQETVSTLATEATASSLLKPVDLDFDASGYLNVNVQDSALASTASTETTLQAIAFGGKKLALRLVTVGDVDYVAEANIGTAAATAAWRVKKVDSSSGIIITWADGNANFDNVATNLAGLTYS